jgi:hypothetical protein
VVVVTAVVGGTVTGTVVVGPEDPIWNMRSVVVLDGGAGVTPAGSKAIVRRRYLLNLIDAGFVVILGLACPNDLQ